MERKIDELYEYCKSKGYNESIEKFEEDLSQLMVEELENEELLNVSGGKRGINALTAGVISALSVAAPLVSAQQTYFVDGNKVMTPVSDTTKVNQDSQRKTTEDMKSKINLKNILLGVGGVSLLGNVVLADAVLSKEPIWSKFDFKKNDVKKLNKVIEEVLFELEKDSIRQLKDFYVGLSKTDKCAFWGKSSVSSESTLLLLEEMFAKRQNANTAENFGFYVSSFIKNAFSKGNNAKQIAQDLKTDITQDRVGVYEWYTLGGKTYIPISLLSELAIKRHLGKMTKPHRAAIKEDFDNLTRDIRNDFGKVIKETDMFDNTTSTDIYSYDNITFSMFLDVCVELLRGCPDNLDIKFDEKVTSKQDVDSAFCRCLDAIKEAWAEGNNSAADIAESLKNEDLLQILKDKIILDNNDENAKWNAVGIALLTRCEKGNYHDAYSKNWSYVDSRARTNVEQPVFRCHLRYQLLPLTIEEKSKGTD